jgi:hypothetical protein
MLSEARLTLNLKVNVSRDNFCKELMKGVHERSYGFQVFVQKCISDGGAKNGFLLDGRYRPTNTEHGILLPMICINN